MKKWGITTLLVLLYFSNTIAQPVNNYQEGHNQGETRIFDGNEFISATDLIIKGNEVQYFLKGASQPISKNLNQINKIEKVSGNKAIQGGIIGGVIGLGIGVPIMLATKKVEEERDGAFVVETTTYQTWPLYLTSITGSLIGHLIGKERKTWQTIFRNGKEITFFRITPEIRKISAYPSISYNYGVGVNINIGF